MWLLCKHVSSSKIADFPHRGAHHGHWSHAFPHRPHSFYLRSQAHSRHQRTSRSALVPPGRWQDANTLVVAGQSVNAGFDENESELGILVFTIAFEMLADGDRLEIQIKYTIPESDGNLSR